MMRERVQVGMKVYSREGDVLGEVVALERHTFLVERGLLLHRDYEVRFTDVAKVEEGHVLLSLRKAELQPLYEERPLRGALGLEPHDLQRARMESSRVLKHRDVSEGREPERE